MQESEKISKKFAVQQVREMAYQFAEIYFTFVSELRNEFGDEQTKKIVTRVLFQRAKERAEEMICIAQKEKIERIPDNIGRVSNVPYLGWDASLGCNHCPYGMIWNKKIHNNSWFQSYARLYCDVTDTTIAEIFTGAYSHRLYENVVLGDNNCERTYYISESIKRGKYTYDNVK